MLQVRDKVRNQIQDGGYHGRQFFICRPGRSPPPRQENTPAASSIVVKKYANRRLYNTETSSYITLDNLAEMIRAGRDFVVYDAKSGEDITRGVLTQIIVEEESKGSAMLPTAFLRQLIGFYGGNLQGVVPRYLEHAMTTFARQQQQMRQMMERTLSPFLPTGVEEMNRQNMAMFERGDQHVEPVPPRRTRGRAAGRGCRGAGRAAEQGEATALRKEVESLRQQLAAAQSAAPRRTRRNSSAAAGGRSTAATARRRPAPAPASDPAEVERLQHEIDSLKQQLAAAHAAAVAPAPATAMLPPAAPANVLADPAGQPTGRSSLRAEPVPRPRTAGDATRS